LIRETLRAGTIAGLAMIPFGAVFGAFGLRVNQYGRKTLRLLVGEAAPPMLHVLAVIQHLAISWLAAVPLLVLVGRIADRRARLLLGAVYGAAFYAAVNSLALPAAFGDPTPWELGFRTVYPSLAVHIVYGLSLALVARPVTPAHSRPVR
jgi:uncharacterized membrane protein YagU involved in acid resistance